MSDRFDELFDDLRGTPAPAPFAPAEAVRARGRQRSRRQAVAAVAAVVLTAGGGAGWVVSSGTGESDSPPVAAPSGASPTPLPSVPDPDPEPNPDAVPGLDQELGWDPVIGPEWLVAPDDLPGSGWVETRHELFESDPAWFWSGCIDPAVNSSDPTEGRRDLLTVSWYSDDGPLPARIDQIVELFEGPSAAQRNLVEVERWAESCSGIGTLSRSRAPVEYVAVDRDFVGRESVLYHEVNYYVDEQGEVQPAQSSRYVAVVRLGAAVTTVIGLDEESTIVAALRATDRIAAGLPLPAYADPPDGTEPAYPQRGDEGGDEVP